MALDTYSNLKDEIADYLDRQDLDTQIDTFIDLAEARHKRELRVREMIKRGAASVSTSVRYLALPAGYLQMKTLRLLTTPVTRLQFINEDEMTRQINSATGKPKWFTIGEEIEFDRVPDDSYTAEMIYFAAPTALSASNTTNLILTNYPGLYLYGALLEAEPFLDNDQRIPTWQSMYDQTLMRSNKNFLKGQYVGTLVERRIGDRP